MEAWEGTVQLEGAKQRVYTVDSRAIFSLSLIHISEPTRPY